MRVSEIRVKRIPVNQGLGVYRKVSITTTFQVLQTAYKDEPLCVCIFCDL